jgi:hypothetical protein
VGNFSGLLDFKCPRWSIMEHNIDVFHFMVHDAIFIWF